MAKATQHVVKNAEGGWAVKKGGSSKASKVYQSQNDAINYAREIAQKQNTELYIHGNDGKIIQKNSYVSNANSEKIKK